MVMLMVKISVRLVKIVLLVLWISGMLSRLMLFRCSSRLVIGRIVIGSIRVWFRCCRFLIRNGGMVVVFDCFC